jgi:hypothetical protein
MLMATNETIAEKFGYGRRLLDAGMAGLRAGERLSRSCNSEHYMADVTRESLKAAVLGAGLAFLGCQIMHRHRGRWERVLTCGAVAFCAEFTWKTRDLGSKLLSSATKEMSKVRDQHWLESNPIDYA